MYVKHFKLIMILFFAAMFLILSFLVVSVTSCASLPTQTQGVVATQSVTIEDGTIAHPDHVDYCPCGVPFDWWNVTLISASSNHPWSIKGREKWQLNWLYDNQGGAAYELHSGNYVMYQGNEYQVSTVDRKTLTMSVVLLGN